MEGLSSEARTTLVTLRMNRRRRSTMEKPKSCAAASIQPLPSWTAWKNNETKFHRSEDVQRYVESEAANTVKLARAQKSWNLKASV